MINQTGPGLKWTAKIVAAYVADHSVEPFELASIIRAVHGALTSPEAPLIESEKPKLSAAQIENSISNDSLMSFENGHHYKSLKRHLGARGLTPAEYRIKWGLPADYPMTAYAYASARSQLAKALGLGTLGRQSKANDAARKSAKPSKVQASGRAAR